MNERLGERRVDLTVEGQPMRKARARVTRHGTYTPKPERENAEALAWEIRLACKGPFRSNVAVAMTFYRSNRLLVDLDNLVKQVLDAANGIAWKDDSQVTMLTARLMHDADRPRAVIAIREDHDSNMRRGEA